MLQTLLLIACFSDYETPNRIDDPDNIAVVKSKIINWSNSLHTFKGCYKLEQVMPDNPNEGQFKFNVEYKFNKNGRYMSYEEIVQGKMRVCSFYKGDAVVLSDNGQNKFKSASKYKYTEGQWLYPNNVFIYPESIFGAINDDKLEKQLTVGNTLLFEINGKIVLSHRGGSQYSGIDVWIAENGLPERIDWSFRVKDEEKIKDYFSLDPFYCRILSCSMFLSNYKNINGVDFPLSNMFINWTPANGVSFHDYKAQENMGAMSKAEFFAKCALSEMGVYRQMTMTINSENDIVVNSELDDKEFDVKIPNDTVLSLEGVNKPIFVESFFSKAKYNINHLVIKIRQEPLKYIYPALLIFIIFILAAIGIVRLKQYIGN
jgi:hypothetical protein